MTPGWAVAIIEPNRDFEADRGLRRAGFRVVFLTYRKLLTGHNRTGWKRSGDFIPRPLFPGYLFLELWPEQPFPRSEQITGYAGLLDDGRKRIDAELVAEWHHRVNAGEFDDKRPERAGKRGKFQPANDPEQRRAILEARFAEMIGGRESVA